MLTLPYLSALRRRIPEASLDFLTRREVGEIPKSIVLFDRVFEIGGARGPPRQVLSAAALIPRLWNRQYDVILDLQRNRISRGVRRLLGPKSWSEFDRFSPRLAGERTRATIEAVGLGELEVFPDLVLRDPGLGEEKLRTAGWDGSSDLVVLNPGGSLPGRSWPIHSYARFAKLWLRRVSDATQFVVLGLSAIAAQTRFLKERLDDRLLNLVGRTSADEAFALVHRAKLALSDDSGLMHMAWVAGVPTLALFGASRAAWASPHGSYSDCVLACARLDGTCLGGSCLEAPPDCLSGLPPDRVLERARVLLHEVELRPKVIHANDSLTSGDA